MTDGLPCPFFYHTNDSGEVEEAPPRNDVTATSQYGAFALAVYAPPERSGWGERTIFVL